MYPGPGGFMQVPPYGYPSLGPIPTNPVAKHQIPMLDSDTSDSIQYSAPSPRQIPPTPQQTFPQTGGINWQIIAGCSPEEVAETNDIQTMRAVLETFVNAEFSQTEAQLMPNPIVAKLFRLLQIGVSYLFDCQEELQNDLTESDKKFNLLKAKEKKLNAALNKAKDMVRKKEKAAESTEKCIVCGRRFKNVEYLDGHMQRRHGALVPAWKSLRCGQMQGLDGIMEQIDDLKQALAKAQHELNKRRNVEIENPNVVHITDHTDEQVRMLQKLHEQQELLLQQKNESQQENDNFRREMRSRLDDAVMALRESHMKLLEQSQHVTPVIPQMQIPDNTINKPHVEFEEPLKPKPSQSSRQLFDLLDSSPFGSQPLPSISSIEAHMNEPPVKQVAQPDTQPNIIRISSDTPAARPVGTPKISLDESESENEGSSDHQRANKQPEPAPQTKPIVMSETIRREMEQDEIMSKLYASSDDEEEEKKEEIPKVLTHSELNESLIFKARQLAAHNVDTDESPNKLALISALKESILTEVDQEYSKLKKTRTYAAISVPYVTRVMNENSPEYTRTYNKLKMIVATEAPIDENYSKDIFKQKDTNFPLVPPIQSLKPDSPEKVNRQNKKIPDLPQSSYTAASLKLPMRSRKGLHRPYGLPGDDDIEVVSQFSSEIDSSESIGFLEEQEIIKEYRAQKKSQPKKKKHQRSSDSSSVSKNISNQFALSESSSSEFDDDKTMVPVFQNDSSAGSTQYLDLNPPKAESSSVSSGNTKKMQIAPGTNDFDVTKKASSVSDTKEEIFDLSDSDNIPNISSDDDDI